MGGFQFGNEAGIGEFSVKSNDELAELIIPKGALPGSVDLNDISVTKVSDSLTKNGTWLVYDLEPDGLVFTEEVMFNVTLDNFNDSIKSDTSLDRKFHKLPLFCKLHYKFYFNYNFVSYFCLFHKG